MNHGWPDFAKLLELVCQTIHDQSATIGCNATLRWAPFSNLLCIFAPLTSPIVRLSIAANTDVGVS